MKVYLLKAASRGRRLLAAASLVILLLTGCSGIGKGVTEALLEKTEAEDKRICQIWGKAFKGIEKGLNKAQGKTKVLMVHGVGNHIPGYTTEFLEKLAKQLNLNARSEEQKNISLSAPLIGDKRLGNLRISHLFNEESHKEMTFYELTWSEITRDEKQLLAFDNSGEYEFRRAKVNDVLKKFSNDTGPDPIIYLGQKREAILAAFSQSICWMATADWQDLPSSGSHTCTGLDDSKVDHIIHDDYVFISHSLGSRIIIDGMQRIAHILANKAQYTDTSRKLGIADKVVEAFREKEMPIFMLSNQLPMLQLGRELPEVSGQRTSYCQPNGAKYGYRMFKETPIIAFSDPNDLLSYGIPAGFSDKYLDSRLCASITNVNINIANVIDAFGISDLANPLEAHLGYDQDDRVIALIAHGIDYKQSTDLVKKRCEFTKTVE